MKNEWMKAQSLFCGITRQLIEKGMTVSTMESCTSGLIASLLTDTEGASAICPGGFVTYCNRAKVMQGVPAAVIETYGVYSEQTAAAMAEACRRAYQADFGIGVTGSFGNPDPNNADSKTGTVFFALNCEKGTKSFCFLTGEQESRFDYKTVTALAVGKAFADLLNS